MVNYPNGRSQSYSAVPKKQKTLTELSVFIDDFPKTRLTQKKLSFYKKLLEDSSFKNMSYSDERKLFHHGEN